MMKYFASDLIYIEVPLYDKTLLGDFYFNHVYLVSTSGFTTAVPSINKDCALESLLPIPISNNLFFNSEGSLVVLFSIRLGGGRQSLGKGFSNDYHFIFNPVVGKAIKISNPNLKDILERAPKKFVLEV